MLRHYGLRLREVVSAALVVAILAGCSAGASTPDPSHDPTLSSDPTQGLPNGRASITVDGVERTFIARAPTSAGNNDGTNDGADDAADDAADGGDVGGTNAGDDAPAVLIALHGLGDTAAGFENATSLTGAVDTDRVMVVYPDGLPTPDGRQSWNAGSCCNPSNQAPVDDVGFLSALIDTLVTEGADPNQIYLAGFSNGGMMAYRAACELGETIAGIAVVAGALVVDDCTSPGVVPLVAVHGTADRVVPYNGEVLSPEVQASLGQVRFPSVAQSVNAWRDRNGCAANAEPAVLGALTTIRYTECAPGGEITVVSIAEGGHTWVTPTGPFDPTPVITDAFGL